MSPRDLIRLTFINKGWIKKNTFFKLTFREHDWWLTTSPLHPTSDNESYHFIPIPYMIPASSVISGCPSININVYTSWHLLFTPLMTSFPSIFPPALRKFSFPFSQHSFTSHSLPLYPWPTMEQSDAKRVGDESHAVVVFSSMVDYPELQSSLTHWSRLSATRRFNSGQAVSPHDDHCLIV